MSKEKIKKFKSISKVLRVLGVIAKVFLAIAMVLAFISLILIPILYANIEVDAKNNKLDVFGYEVKFEERGDDVFIITDDYEEIISNDKVGAEFLITVLDETITLKYLVVIELSLVVGIVTFILGFIEVGYLIKIFRNFEQKENPFEKENSLFFRKAANISLIVFIILVISLFICSIIVSDYRYSIEIYGLMEALVFYVLAYVFEYGYKISQKEKE